MSDKAKPSDKTSGQNSSTKRTKHDEKKARLAKALRENLQKRKQHARSQKTKNDN